MGKGCFVALFGFALVFLILMKPRVFFAWVFKDASSSNTGTHN